ncbi:hypothetical protein [Candidatus Methanoprimaticola sp. MG2]|uniref:hypothetical protein n=1 Tax=Candidatus Methanoprimaticola sp. MG2 TaxID=3228838 RepID=UPI0039C677C2
MSRPRAKRSESGRKPDHEAESVEVRADIIDKPDYFPRSGVHGGNWFRAKGDVVIEVNRSLPGKDKDVRPETGTVLEGEDTEVIVTGRRVDKKSVKKNGKDIGTASGGVRIFGRLRRRRR